MAGSGKGKSPRKTLHEEVKEVLLTLMRDTSAPATARASAARSLVLMLAEEKTPEDQREASGMTIDEIDAEIAGIQQRAR